MGKPQTKVVLSRTFTIQLFDDFLTVLQLNSNDPEVARDQHRASNPMEALMQAPPGEEPERSQEELLELRELLEDALEELDDLERQVVLATVVEKVPLRRLAMNLRKPHDRRRRYSKSGAAKIRERAFAKLRYMLEDEPMVLEHIAKNHSTNGSDDVT